MTLPSGKGSGFFPVCAEIRIVFLPDTETDLQVVVGRKQDRSRRQRVGTDQIHLNAGKLRLNDWTACGKGIGGRTGRRTENHAVCPVFAQHHIVPGHSKLNDTGKIPGNDNVVERQHFPLQNIA